MCAKILQLEAGRILIYFPLMVRIHAKPVNIVSIEFHCSANFPMQINKQSEQLRDSLPQWSFCKSSSFGLGERMEHFIFW